MPISCTYLKHLAQIDPSINLIFTARPMRTRAARSDLAGSKGKQIAPRGWLKINKPPLFPSAPKPSIVALFFNFFFPFLFSTCSRQ